MLSIKKILIFLLVIFIMILGFFIISYTGDTLSEDKTVNLSKINNEMDNIKNVEYSTKNESAQSLSNSIFVKRVNNFLVKNGSKLILKGVNLDAGRVDPGNGDWQFNCPSINCRPIYDELWSERDYKKIKQIGFNSVRLMLNYMYFEDDSNPYNYKQEGWDWLDKHIKWAKNNDLLLILDMHVPQGGLQTSNVEDRIWDVEENQKRLINLWKEIARRYKNENIIAGYNLLNEPQPKNSCNPWDELSNEIIKSIREVDNNHLIVVERCNWIRDVKGYDGFYKNVHPNWQFLVDDENIMYDFHFYMPQDFTLQCYPETNCMDGLKYPDDGYHLQSINGELFSLNKKYLENEIDILLEFSKRNNVPASVGEWAPGPATFGKGGEEYIIDAKEIFNKNNLSWFYFDYWTIHTNNKLKTIRPIISQIVN